VSWRLEFEIVDGKGIHFYGALSVIRDLPTGYDERVTALCYMPIETMIVPDRWAAPGGEVILDYIRPLFKDARDLVTFMWLIGNAVIMPKSLLLLGAGGTVRILTGASPAVTALCQTGYSTPVLSPFRLPWSRNSLARA
jgi:hypothetical protein